MNRVLTFGLVVSAALAACARSASVRAAPEARSEGRVVLDFADEAEARRWAPINDGVMGGRSSSRFVHTGADSSAFEGSVSLENNGGFASARRQPGELDLADAAALALTFRGDGNAYKLRLRTTDAFDGVSYEAAFGTERGRWQTHRFELADFRPVWRGRRVPDASPLAFEDVRTVGLLISDEQVGPFRLELKALAAR